jgi:predicted dehydrogenase
MIRLGLLGADATIRAALAPLLLPQIEVSDLAHCDAVLNPDRYLPSRQLIHLELAAGKLGEPGLVRIHRWEASADQLPSAGDLPGPLLCDLDIALWLHGQPPNLVYASEPPAPSSAEKSGRLIQIHLGFPSSRMALIDYASSLPAGDGYTALSVIGSAGAAYADDHQNMQLAFLGGRPQAVRTTEGFGYLRRLADEVNHVVAAGSDFADCAKAWHNVQALAAAIHKSLATREAVPLEGA